MTGAALFLLSYAGWFLFLAGTTPWPPAALPLFIASSAIAVLYAFSLAGFLLPGAWILASLGFALGLAGLIREREHPKDYFARLLEPGPAIFFLLALLLWLLLSGTYYSSWDEFSHWGFIAKEIFLRNALPPLESALRFKDYPPGTALFQYYVVFFTGWSEGATAFAQSLLLLAASTALLQGSTWKQGLRLAAVIAVSYLLLVLFNYKPQSLYVDHVLGFFFGAAIASSLLPGNGGLGTLLRLLPTLLVLPIIKASGLVLALLAGAAIATNHLIGVVSGDRKKLWASLALCALILLSPLLAARTWSRRVHDLGLSKTFETGITTAQIGKSFSAAATERDKTTIRNFTKALASKQVGRTVPALFLILMLTIAAFLAAREDMRPVERQQVRAAFLWMLAGFAIYAAGLLILYLYSFSSYEGPRLASYSRYMGVFFVGWSFVTAAFFLRLPLPSRHHRLIRYTEIFVVLAAAVALVSALTKRTGEEKLRLHADIREKAAYALSRTPATSRIYIIWQASDGFEPQVMAYELAPRVTSTRGGSWSLGKPYSPEDVWTVDTTPADWAKSLKDYDFVMLGKVDKAFWDRYSVLFEFPSKARTNYLFKVTLQNNKVKLQSI